jgi:ADP-heptose:LPS heptosyltransferase
MQEEKAKNSGIFRRTFFSFIGESRSTAFLKFLLKRKHRAPPLKFPVDIPSVKEVLIILPEDYLEVLHQLKNIVSLMTLFKHAGITLLCEREVAPYVKMLPGLNIVEYCAQDHFSSDFSRTAQQFRGVVDICFLLDTSPDLPMLYLAGSTAAPVRVGYCNAGDFPFLNLHIRPSPQRVYLADWYCSMAETFGSKTGDIRWRVARKTVEEVDHLIKELKIAPDASLIGFDALHFIRTFGSEWTEAFMRRIASLQAGTIYFHVKSVTLDQELVWLCKQNVPSFADLSASRLAALVGKSKFVISGKTPMYALAGLLHRPAVGFFAAEEIDRYCPHSKLLKGVPYSGRPTDEEIDQLVGLIGTMTPQANTK